MDFMIGCNYWASNAGTEMWVQWDEEAVREDFEILSSHGIEYLRVFPNWRDFQPVMPIYGSCDQGVAEYKLEGDREPENPYYLDEVMMDRFSTFCDIAEEYNLKLIVGLLTGGMSGRLFVPSALYGKNLCTDPLALNFEQKLIRGMVTRFKNKKAIHSWDLGNECNNICGWSMDRYAALAWTGIIVNAIKAYDNTRPVVSGMDCLGLETGVWLIQDQAEYCDILTIHPYPYWHEPVDYLGSHRTMLYPACGAKLYGDIGGKPCFSEETGTMGPSVCKEDMAADFMRLNIFSNWANDSKGIMWWCANEQMHLMTDPYTRILVENELGMIDSNHKPKPVLLETKKIAEVMKSFDFELPKSKEDALCVLTRSQNQWGVAFMTYCLAKQAGLNIGFAYSELEIPDSNTYIIPSVKGVKPIDKKKLLQIEEKVKNGATLYLSLDNGILPQFKELFGMEVVDSRRYAENLTVEINGKTIPFTRERRVVLESVGAKVLANDSTGNPAITKYAYGKGTVYLVNFPLEAMLINQPDMVEGDYCEIYKAVFANQINSHEVITDNKKVAVTLHPDTDGSICCVAINYTADEQKLDLKIQEGYNIDKVYYGDTDVLKPFDAAIFKIKK